MELWHQILLIVLALMIVFLFGPRAKQAMEQSPKGSREDWLGLIKPLGLLIAFIALLIYVVRN